MDDASAPRITRVEFLPPRGARVRIHLEGTGLDALGGDPLNLDVALEAFERSQVTTGMVLTAERRTRLLELDADVRVREAALSLLSRRARTRRELATRLVRKGFSPDRVEGCLDRLTSSGLLDDEAVAASFVRDRLRLRPKGRAILLGELRAKGIASGAAERVLDGVLEQEETSEERIALEAAEGWANRQGASTLRALATRDRSPASLAAHRRLHGYLARRGFRGDALRAAIDRAIGVARVLTSG